MRTWVRIVAFTSDEGEELWAVEHNGRTIETFDCEEEAWAWCAEFDMDVIEDVTN